MFRPLLTALYRLPLSKTRSFSSFATKPNSKLKTLSASRSNALFFVFLISPLIVVYYAAPPLTQNSRSDNAAHLIQQYLGFSSATVRDLGSAEIVSLARKLRLRETLLVEEIRGVLNSIARGQQVPESVCKDAAPPTYEIHRNGIAVFRNALTVTQQAIATAEFLTKFQPYFGARLHQPADYNVAFMQPTPPVSFNDIARSHVRRFTEKMAQEIASHNAAERNPQLRFPVLGHFKADNVVGVRYQQHEHIHYHRDGAEYDWAFDLCIGHSATFKAWRADSGSYSPGLNEARADALDVVLRSGDAIYFHGYALIHGVSKIFGPETAPAWWSRQAEFARFAVLVHDNHDTSNR